MEPTYNNDQSRSCLNELNYDSKTFIEKCNQLLEEGELELAQQFADRGINNWGRTPETLELLANVHLEANNWDEAYKLFKEAVELSKPKGWASAYMSLGQMTTGQESASYYQLGIQLYLEKVKELAPNSEELVDIRRKVSNGFVCLTELYLTDLCFEDNAESNCESYLSKALEIDPNNPEIYQTLASVRLSQQRIEEAQKVLMTSFGLWYEQDVPPPHYNVRLALARMMLEAEMYEPSLQVLEHLEKDDDQVVEVWYLYGLVNQIMANREEEVDIDLCTEAWGCLALALKLSDSQHFEDEGILEHIREIQTQLLTVCPSLINFNPEEEEEEGNMETDALEDELIESTDEEDIME